MQGAMYHKNTKQVTNGLDTYAHLDVSWFWNSI